MVLANCRDYSFIDSPRPFKRRSNCQLSSSLKWIRLSRPAQWIRRLSLCHPCLLRIQILRRFCRLGRANIFQRTASQLTGDHLLDAMAYFLHWRGYEDNINASLYLEQPVRPVNHLAKDANRQTALEDWVSRHYVLVHRRISGCDGPSKRASRP